LKTVSIFILLVYWSLIILAPVLAKNIAQKDQKKFVLPLKKPQV